MLIPPNWEKNSDVEISENEFNAIQSFLDSYVWQNFIVADEYHQGFVPVPLKGGKVILKTPQEINKRIRFCKKVLVNGQEYIVDLELCFKNLTEFVVQSLKVITNEKAHFIDLYIQDQIKNLLLVKIKDIFDIRKIVSPEQAYRSRMYTDKKLLEFIRKHEWKKIESGVSQDSSLANALFIIREEYSVASSTENCLTTSSVFNADFGTILYQLIAFRMKCFNELSGNDLRKLDELILKLSKTSLLKVGLAEDTTSFRKDDVKSVLLEENEFYTTTYVSTQFNESNMELVEEHKLLKKITQ